MAKSATSRKRANGRATSRRAQRLVRRQRFNVSWLRTPILVPLGQLLIVLIYCRKSKEEQAARSVNAQRTYCERFLDELGITKRQIIFIHDDGISGEVRSRPGIDRVRQIIADKGCHLLLCEESSRPFRDPVWCVELFRDAVDQDIRAICINDYIDTDEPEWEERLHDAQRHHAGANRLTVMRIRRDQVSRWENDDAMGPLRPGYRRIPSVPATKSKPAQGPFRDETVPKWKRVIKEAYKQFAGDQDPDQIVAYLDEKRLPGMNEEYTPWNRPRLYTLIRSTIYRGVEEFRNTVSTKQRSSGKRSPRPATEEEKWERDASKMRMVPDWLWYKANDRVESLSTNTDCLSGPDHPLYGIDRSSYGILGEDFICGICEERMYQEGRNEGGYRCSQARSKRCWNRTTALRELTHSRIADQIHATLRQIDCRFDEIIEAVRRLAGDTTGRAQRIEDLSQRTERLDGACDQLLDQMEQVRQHERVPERLRLRYMKREYELARAHAERERLKSELNGLKPPMSKELASRRDETVQRLATLDRTNSELLHQVIGRVRAVPYQFLDTMVVVLRAHFEVSLFPLLPERLRAVLTKDEFHTFLPTLPIVINLFNPPHYLDLVPKYVAVKHEHPNWGLDRIGNALGVSKTVVQRIMDRISQIESLGLTDPYIRLSTRPAKVARWGCSGDSSGEPAEANSTWYQLSLWSGI